MERFRCKCGITIVKEIDRYKYFRHCCPKCNSTYRQLRHKWEYCLTKHPFFLKTLAVLNKTTEISEAEFSDKIKTMLEVCKEFKVEPVLYHNEAVGVRVYAKGLRMHLYDLDSKDYEGLYESEK